MIGIVVSTADRASEHIGDALLDLADWTDHGNYYRRDGFELRTYDALHLDLDGVAADFTDPDLLVFVSRHSGQTGPLLSAHITGNLGAAEYGGNPGELAEACPNALRAALHALDEYAPPGYDVTLECTHHGPSDPGAPSMFVELGSDEAQWDDPTGAKAVARAVLDLEEVAANTDRTFVAFGGGHYAPRPTRIVRETDWACGHIAADWGLDDLGNGRSREDVIEQVFERSGATLALVDGDRPALVGTIESLGYRVVGETWLRETDRVPLSVVDELETRLATVDDGLRFGVDAQEECSYTIVDLPGELLADAAGIDTEAVLDAAEETAVAFETDENGTRVSGRAAFADGRYDDFIDAVCGVLEEKYDTVEQRGDVVVVHERAFDPERAAALGVPEGPAFGALAAGESVTVDGRTVDPEDVTFERTQKYRW